MKIAVFSDIHGNYQALDAILKDIKKRKIDKIIYLGDAVSIGPDSSLCLNTLNNKADVFLLGNHEQNIMYDCENDDDISKEEISHHKWVLKTLDKKDIKKLKEHGNYFEILIGNKKFVFFHFFLKKSNSFERLSIFSSKKYIDIVNNIDADYMFFGHYHEGIVETIKDKKIFGVGSSGCTHSEHTHYYLIDDSDDINISKINVIYDREKFIKRIKSVNYSVRDEVSKSFFGIK